MEKTPRAKRSTTAKKPIPANRRGSREAIEKRRAARAFNDLLAGGARPARDGRTEKRRQRLLAELKKGTARAGGEPLKPIEVLLRVQALIELGETAATIRRSCKPPRPVESTREVIEGVKRLHEAYGFAPDAYQFVGIDAATLERARVVVAAGGSTRKVAVKKAGSAERAGGTARERAA